jgi:hypothetical protein
MRLLSRLGFLSGLASGIPIHTGPEGEPEMSVTGDWMMWLGMVIAVGTASFLIYAWVLNEPPSESAQVREDAEELRPAA